MSELSDFTGLSKAAVVLAQRASSIIGDFLKPVHIRRIARAKADAAITSAETDIEIEDLKRRALRRWVEEEASHQRNMENTTAKALSQLKDDARPDLLNHDWLVNYYDKCRKVSDEEMQNLWSRILSGEANAPGSFSRRTVNFVSELDKEEAELFSTLCRFSWFIGTNLPLIIDHRDKVYNEYGVDYTSLSHLHSIGLVDFHSLGQHHVSSVTQEKILVSYFDRSYLLDVSKASKKILEVGQIVLTKIGKELAPLCSGGPVVNFRDYVLEKWKEYSPKTVLITDTK